MKSIKRSFSLVLTLVLVLSIFVFAQPVSAATQSEAVTWALSMLNVGLDYDGDYGCQCVDLIYYYYAYLGATPQGGDASAYITNTLPSGWERYTVYSGFVPQPGDIAVWKVNSSNEYYGHVGIVTDANASNFNAVNQNYAYNPTCTKNYFSVRELSCVIRPNFTPMPQTCTIAYNANGGNGVMSSQIVSYGSPFTLSNNSFTNAGKTFVGWNVHRSSDDTWFVPYIGWVSQTEINQKGYIKATYRNQLSDVINAGWTSVDDTLTFYAIWDGCTIAYNSNGGVGTMSAHQVPYWFDFTLKKNEFKKQGYIFAGWNVHRSSDNTWFVNDVGWVSSSVISNKGYTKAIYKDQLNENINGGWTSKSDEKLTFYATWRLCTTHEYTNECDGSCNVCGAERSIRHTYTNDCDTTCNICEFPRTITHAYDLATCTEPQICKICGDTYGEALGHTYENGKCIRCWRFSPDATAISTGDLNDDERIDAKDALEVLKAAVGKANLTEQQKIAADVNKDGDINAKDALEMLKYAVGKPSVLDRIA